MLARPAYLYILFAPTKSGRKVWKIGITYRTPAERLAEVKSEGRKNKDCSQHAQLYRSYKISQPEKLEKYLHRYYAAKRYKGIKGSGGTEWFELRYPFYALFVCRARRLLELFLYCVLYVLIMALIFHLIKTLCYG
jgi:T5orf172 domain